MCNMVCSSANCPRKNQCGKYYSNYQFKKEEVYTLENLYSYGWGSVSTDGFIEYSICGENGNWGMYEPAKHIIAQKELYESMKDIIEKYGDDKEELHVQMDLLMCKMLRDLGYGDGVDVFLNTPIYYC